jgi:hypothetical protein
MVNMNTPMIPHHPTHPLQRNKILITVVQALVVAVVFKRLKKSCMGI